MSNSDIPKYGLKVPFDHEYPENRSQDYKPSLRVFWSMLPMIFRYFYYYIKYKFLGKSIIMDYVHPQRAKRIYGVPVGGIGSGSIGRGFRGEFCRFQMKPGIYEWNTVDANQFIVTIKDAGQKTIFQSLLSHFPKTTLPCWEANIHPSKCHYTGLYPRSWSEYDLSEFGIKLTCRQVSPVFPHNYKDTSLPCAVFIWNVENVSKEDRTVTIAFTFKNGTCNKAAEAISPASTKAYTTDKMETVILHHSIDSMFCSYALSCTKDPDATISKSLYFNPNSDGCIPWEDLKSEGRFVHNANPIQVHLYGDIGVGLACQIKVPPSQKKEIEMSLVWDMPLVWFLNKGVKHYRYYTKHFGKKAAVVDISEYALSNYKMWEEEICKWQNPILNDPKLPDWYKGALFNQTYFVSDGGSLWVDVDEEYCNLLPESDPRRTIGKFFYLEGHEYKMCNTYDVHYYASYALQMNWPLIQKSIQYDFRDAIFVELPEKINMINTGVAAERKSINTVPHDTGDPGEQPFILLNSYIFNDISIWRDLPTKFVLQVFRDGLLNKPGDVDVVYWKDMYQACYTIMVRTEKFDIDGDGLIENSDQHDQTYDTWLMEGASAYCGSLWLAALYAMVTMSTKLGNDEDGKKFNILLMKARKSFNDKLWNGEYYNFDCSKYQSNSIMADQLCGHWYLRNCNVGYEILPKDRVQSSLKKIYENNVLSFCDGTMGVVNGFINGGPDFVTIQSEEVWTGVTYAVAGLMIQEGMVEEAFKTAGGMYRSMRDRFGLEFDTPEALYAKDYYRSISYMRPLSIWSMQLALEQSRTRGDSN